MRRREKAESNYSPAPTGASIQQVEAEIREAIEFHIEGLREDGSLIPSPSSQVEYIEIAA
jgi:predicted RNase H-like HicB family nuclease